MPDPAYPMPELPCPCPLPPLTQAICRDSSVPCLTLPAYPMPEPPCPCPLLPLPQAICKDQSKTILRSGNRDNINYWKSKSSSIVGGWPPLPTVPPPL
jgi:hypothetical protein